MNGPYYNFAVDTGSNVIWVAGANCNGCSTIANFGFDCSSAPNCTNIGLSASQSYGSGSVSGSIINTNLNILFGNVTGVNMISVNYSNGSFS